MATSPQCRKSKTRLIRLDEAQRLVGIAVVETEESAQDEFVTPEDFMVAEQLQPDELSSIDLEADIIEE